MRSWKTSASESVFSVQVPSLDAQHSLAPKSGAPASRSVSQRNTKPCGRCSDKQKKCDISPPYSPTRCGACTKANIPVCPPHKARRLHNLKQATRRIFSSERSFSTSSGPAASQSQPVGLDNSHYQRQMKDAVEDETAAVHLGAELGLDPAAEWMASQAEMPAENSILNNTFCSASDGGLGSTFSLLPSNDFPSQPEDSSNYGSFIFSTTFIPAFLPSL